MTTEAFEQSVTDAINVKLLDAQGAEQEWEETESDGLVPHCSDNVGPHIAKIPLRSEYRDLIRASELYAEQAARHQGEADRLRQLASDAKTQAENLRRVAGL